MPVTYTAIASVKGNGSAGAITFTSIPQTYTDLVLVMNIFTNIPANSTVQVNGDTGANYASTILTANGSAATSSRNSNSTAVIIQSTCFSAPTLSNLITMNFMDYTDTNMNKTVLIRGGRSNQGTEMIVNLWRNNAAITSITLNSQTYTTDATFTLYGIKAA
jgi:hypothetical protein